MDSVSVYFFIYNNFQTAKSRSLRDHKSAATTLKLGLDYFDTQVFRQLETSDAGSTGNKM